MSDAIDESSPFIIRKKMEYSELNPNLSSTVPNFYAIINAMRGYSMMYVVLEHTLKAIGINQCWGDAVGFPSWLTPLLWPLGAQKSCGANGVAFFFILSGTVAWLPFLDVAGRNPRTLPTNDGISGLVGYWLKRGSRILPLYFIIIYMLYNTQSFWGWIVWDTSLAGDAANSPSWWMDYALTMTLSNSLSHLYFYPAACGSLWAIGPIFWFSILLFPIFAILFQWNKQKPLLSQSLAVSSAILIAMLIRVVSKIPNFGLQVDETQGAVSDSCFGRMDDFVVGMASAYVLRAKLSAPIAVITCVCGYLAVAAYTFVIQESVILGFDYSTYRYIGTYWMFAAILAPLRSMGYAACFAGLHHCLQSQELTLPRFLIVTNHLIQGFGTMSYSVYAWHSIALVTTFGGSVANNEIGLPFTPWRLVFCFVFMIAPMASLSYYYIEQGRWGNYPQAIEDLSALLAPSDAGLIKRG